MERKKQNKFYPGIHSKDKHLNKSGLAKNIPEALAGFNYTRSWQIYSCHPQADGRTPQIILILTSHRQLTFKHTEGFQPELINSMAAARGVH